LRARPSRSPGLPIFRSPRRRTNCTGNRIHSIRPLAGVAVKRQTGQGGTAFLDLEIFGLAFMALMAGGAYWRCPRSSREGRTPVKVHPCVPGFRPDHPECFPPWWQQTESIVRGGSLCARAVFSTCGVCPVSFHRRTHQGPHFRSAAALWWKTLGLA